MTRLRSKVGQEAGFAGGKRAKGLSVGVGGEEKRTRLWELQGVRGSAAAGAEHGCVTAGGAAEVDKQARRWALQGVGNGWAPRKRSGGGSGEGVVASAKAPRSSVRG